jgi:3-phosphoshikimate 1-carboxyvinyltransferase
MLGALTALGVKWELYGKDLLVHGGGMIGLKSPSAALNCGNSATTLRLLAGALAAAGIPCVLDGSPGLRRRPMDRIVEPLQQMGVAIEATNGCAPLRLQPRLHALNGLEYILPVASAQVKSCLILAALAAEAPVTLREPGPSRDHTERMLNAMGARIESWREEIRIDEEMRPVYVTRVHPLSGKSLRQFSIEIPGDISAAAFLLVAGLITPGSDLTLRGVGLNPTRTGIVDALQTMGGDIEVLNVQSDGGEPVGDLRVRSSELRAVEVSGDLVVRMIDEFPAFAVAAAYADGLTVVRDAAELRLKESDRITDLGREMRRLGVAFYETEDGFQIMGGSGFDGGEVETHGDHRLAMAFSIAGLAARGRVTVQDSGIIEESFPGFAALLVQLGALLRQYTN